MVRFDAYTATAEGLNPSHFVEFLADFHAGDVVKSGAGFHHFGERLAVYDDTGAQVGACHYGGSHGARVMCEVKGERTPLAVDWIRQHQHRCTRVDSCVDFERPGVFEELRTHVERARSAHGIYRQNLGDWDQPELGRTVMLGAPTSAVRVRLYEKGKQPEYRHLGRTDYVRLEIQVRPQKQAREVFSTVSAVDVWSASRWTRQIAAEAMGIHLQATPAGTVWRERDIDRAISHMAGQYGAHLVGLASHLGGWEELGRRLGEMVEQTRRVRRH